MAKRHNNRIGDLEALFVRLEELVLANSGEDDFEEALKLVIAKLWDERCGQSKRFRAYESESETYRQITTLLREADRSWSGILEAPASLRLTPAHLQVCVEAMARHTISDASLEVMDGFFEFLVAKSAKGSKGQFFTPRYVVELCVRMLRPTKEETVVDPACGSGGFLIHTLNYVREQSSLASQADLHKYCMDKLWGFDIDPRAVRIAKALMILAGGDNTNIVRLNSLLRPDIGGLFILGTDTDGSMLTIEDVCRSRLRHHKGYDLILTNPPFAGEVRERHILEGYALTRGKLRVERDVLFLERCVQLLRPGGRMAIVLPHNKLAIESWSYLREWLLRKTHVLAVVGLGRNTFLPHTHQKTSILFLQKHEAGDNRPREQRIFFAISERDGKNSKGQLVLGPASRGAEPVWDRVDHDLDQIVEAFHDFRASELLEAKA